MGCLKLIIKLAIVILAIIGFKAIGGWDWCVKNFPKLHFGEKPTQEVLIQKSRDVADLSKIPDEYEISKSANVLGYRAVIANHDASGQKLAVVNENKNLKLTKEDFKNGQLKKKIDGINKKLEYQYVHIENFKILKQGTMHAMGQTVPYALFEADVTNLPVKKIKGMISVATDKEGKNKIIVSANEGNKYSQIIAQEFFKNVKLSDITNDKENKQTKSQKNNKK